MTTIEYLNFETFREVTLHEFEFLCDYGFNPTYDPSADTSFRSAISYVGSRSTLLIEVDIREDFVELSIVTPGDLLDDALHRKSLWEVYPDPMYVSLPRAEREREMKRQRRKRKKQPSAEYLRESYAFEIEILKSRGQAFLANQV